MWYISGDRYTERKRERKGERDNADTNKELEIERKVRIAR